MFVSVLPSGIWVAWIQFRFRWSLVCTGHCFDVAFMMVGGRGGGYHIGNLLYIAENILVHVLICSLYALIFHDEDQGKAYRVDFSIVFGDWHCNGSRDYDSNDQSEMFREHFLILAAVNTRNVWKKSGETGVNNLKFE